MAGLSVDLNRPAEKRKRKKLGRPSAVEQEQLVGVPGNMISPIFTASGQRVQFLTMDEIVQKHGWKIYKDMMHDDQVKACVRFKQLLVYGRQWDIKPANDEDNAKEIAAFVAENLRRINFVAKVKEALSAYAYGFSFAEIVWEITEYKGKQAVMLKDLKFRDPSSIQINCDIHGNITDFEQETGFLRPRIRINREKSFIWTYQGEFSNHYGISDLRAAYRNWFAKKYLMQFWSVFLERLGAPLTMTKYPLGASEELKRTLVNIMQSLSSKTEIIIPEGVEIELLQAERQGKGDYLDACNYHDNAISRAVLVPALLGVSSGGPARGSDSQSRLHLRVLFKTADQDGKDLMFEIERQVVKQLVDYNFNVDAYPTFLWQDYGEFEAMEIADAIRLLHNAGIVDMDQADVNYARSILGLPVRGEDDEEDEVLRPQPAPMGQGGMGAGADGAGGSSSGQGNTRASKSPASRKTRTKGTTVTKK
jgi:phage gp29-like protein